MECQEVFTQLPPAFITMKFVELLWHLREIFFNGSAISDLYEWLVMAFVRFEIGEEVFTQLPPALTMKFPELLWHLREVFFKKPSRFLGMF